jgi:hypothetical protein
MRRFGPAVITARASASVTLSLVEVLSNHPRGPYAVAPAASKGFLKKHLHCTMKYGTL